MIESQTTKVKRIWGEVLGNGSEQVCLFERDDTYDYAFDKVLRSTLGENTLVSPNITYKYVK